MANNNNNNNNENPTEPSDWLNVTQKELDDANSPLGMIKEKPLSYFDALTRNFVDNPNLFQANLGQFPQNFLVVTGPGSKVRILHSLFGVNADPDSASSAIVVGIYGANKVAPFKTITATSAVLALTPPTRRGGNKKDQEPTRIPSIQQFAEVESEEDFGDLVGGAEGEEVDVLGKYPSSHFLHPQIFMDIKGKREWEAITLGFKLVTLYGNDGDEEGIPAKLRGTHQLRAFLWVAAKPWGNPVTLREIPESGEVVSLCSRKVATLDRGRLSQGAGRGPSGEEMEQNSQSGKVSTR
jgi:hypothetical protein